MGNLIISTLSHTQNSVDRRLLSRQLSYLGLELKTAKHRKTFHRLPCGFLITLLAVESNICSSHNQNKWFFETNKKKKFFLCFLTIQSTANPSTNVFIAVHEKQKRSAQDLPLIVNYLISRWLRSKQSNKIWWLNKNQASPTTAVVFFFRLHVSSFPIHCLTFIKLDTNIR